MSIFKNGTVAPKISQESCSDGLCSAFKSAKARDLPLAVAFLVNTATPVLFHNRFVA